jgi:hypothetical protein
VQRADGSGGKGSAVVAGRGAHVEELGAAQLLARTLDHAIAGHLGVSSRGLSSGAASRGLSSGAASRGLSSGAAVSSGVASRGAASRIDVECDDEQFCVRDDGPGLAWSRHDVETLAQVARRLEIDSARFGVRRRWVVEDLELLADGEPVGRCDTQGTCVRVWPEQRALERDPIDVHALEQRLLGIHRVRPSLRVSFNGQPFDEPRGVEAWVAAHRCTRATTVHAIEARRGTTELELAWAWLPAFGSARRLSYVNLRETVRDGSHVDALLRALARVHAVPLALARERCLALVSVIAVNPRFSEADDGRLHDPALERWITELVEQQQS